MGGGLLGYALGLPEHHRERKEMLADEQRKNTWNDLHDQLTTLRTNAAQLNKLNDPEYLTAASNIHQQMDQLYDPIHAPGALQRDWEFIKSKITRKPLPAPPSLATGTLTMPSRADRAPQPIELPGTPVTMPGTSVSGPVPYTAVEAPDITLTPATPKPIPATPLAQAAKPPATTTPAAPPAPPAAQPKLSSYQRKLQAQRDRAQQEARQFMAAGPLTPEQEAQVASRKNLVYINQARKDFRATNPDATPTQEAAFMSDLIAKQYGITQRPDYKAFRDPNGLVVYRDITQPIEPGLTAIAPGAETTDTRKRADYAAYKQQHPEYTGTFEQWGVEQGQLAKLAVPTSRDDRYIVIEQKRNLGQPLTPDEQAYAGAYDLYVQKRIIAPGVAKAAAFAGDRYMPFVDPSNPEQVIVLPARVGSQAGLGTPQSIAFQTDKAVTKYFTVGKGGENIAYFNTATDHLKLLGEVADALNNADIQKLNQFANAFATATGDPAPTNFEAVKSAVAGELAKTFTGKGATVEEIAQINQVINQVQSPEQLHGAINYYTSLMGGKLNALRSQYTQAKQGQPAFPAAPGAGGGGGKTVKMKAPDGTIQDVPSDQVKHYESQGAVVVK